MAVILAALKQDPQGFKMLFHRFVYNLRFNMGRFAPGDKYKDIAGLDLVE